MKLGKISVKPRKNLQVLKPRKAIHKKTSSSREMVPERPILAFHLFMKDFVELYREEFDSAVRIAGGETWDAMTEAERREYDEKASEVRALNDKSAEIYERMKATTAVAAAVTIKEKLSATATTGGPMDQ